MALLKEEKEQIIHHFCRSPLDTGSSQVQVALLTFRIKKLTEHFKVNKQDYHSRRGLLRMVNQRRKLLNYLKGRDLSGYRSLISDLGLRK